MIIIPNIKTFVVDDDPFFLNIMEQVLQNLGITDQSSFLTAHELEQALVEQPEIIFLDYNLDDTNGFEVLKKIKRYDPDIFVILISAQGEIKPVVDSLKLGAFDYIQKSKDTENQVRTVIEKIISVKASIENKKPTLLKRIFNF